MITIEYYEGYPEVSRELCDSLWKQGVCMDDWDYLLFIPNPPADFMIRDEDGDKPSSWYFQRLLTGCCDNKWYSVADFNGRSGVVGVAYHA